MNTRTHRIVRVESVRHVGRDQERILNHALGNALATTSIGGNGNGERRPPHGFKHHGRRRTLPIGSHDFQPQLTNEQKKEWQRLSSLL
jgi:hypothetical protein